MAEDGGLWQKQDGKQLNYGFGIYKRLFDMKTIEERAKEYAPDPFDPDYILPAREGHIVNQQRIAYIAGATEQKAIDDAESLKLESIWVKEAQINHDDVANYKQGYRDAVEKACEWLEGYCCEIGCKYDCNFDDIMVDGPKRFRKAMEE